MKIAQEIGLRTDSMNTEPKSFIDEVSDYPLMVPCGEEKECAKTMVFELIYYKREKDRGF